MYKPWKGGIKDRLTQNASQRTKEDSERSDLIDLHTHSTASDGSLSPRELIKHAREMGLKAIALTDHDTVAGISEAKRASMEAGIEFVPGIEISAQWEPGTMHILGYYLDCNDKHLNDTLKRLQKARKKRNLRLIEKLNKLGINISYQEVEKIARGQMGRLHISRILVEKGHASSINSAFRKYLAKGTPAYVPKTRLDPEKAIALIRKAKGVPVLAHPYTLGVSDTAEIEKLIQQLMDAGLQGIEIFYPEHSKEFEAFCIAMARKFNLLGTGGSDFHGKNKDEIKIGIGRGNLRVHYSVLSNLRRMLRIV